MRKLVSSVAAVGIIIGGGLFIASPVQALTVDNWRIDVGCNNATLDYDGVVWDRDNTGDGQESYALIVTDGAGNTLLHDGTSSDVGDVLGVTTETIPYLAPTKNPVRFMVISDAGNGFDEQIVIDAIGYCDEISSPPETVPATFSIDFGMTLTGSLSPFESDPDLNPLTFSLATGPEFGDVTLNADGSFLYEPTVAGHDTDIFVASVSDGNGVDTDLTVTITIAAATTPVAPAPPQRIETGTR